MCAYFSLKDSNVYLVSWVTERNRRRQNTVYAGQPFCKISLSCHCSRCTCTLFSLHFQMESTQIYEKLNFCYGTFKSRPRFVCYGNTQKECPVAACTLRLSSMDCENPKSDAAIGRFSTRTYGMEVGLHKGIEALCRRPRGSSLRPSLWRSCHVGRVLLGD